jgi:hypothetical protein
VAMVKAYASIYGQCTEAMQIELKSDPDYEIKSDDRDPIWLLGAIKKIKSGLHPSRNKMRFYFMKLKELFQVRQENNESLNAFRKRIRSAIDTLSLAGGDGVLQPTFDSLASASTTFDKDLAEEFATMFFMYQANQRIFAKRLLIYEQQDEDGNDIFPKKMGNAYEVLAHHSARQGGGRMPRRYGRQFLQPGHKIKRRMPIAIAEEMPMHVFQLMLTLVLLSREQMEKYGP